MSRAAKCRMKSSAPAKYRHIHHMAPAADLLNEAADRPTHALNCRLTEIIAYSGSHTASGSMSV